MTKPDISADDAYLLTSPEGSRHLYARWAETYDEDFVRAQGYVYHQKVSSIFSARFQAISGPVLDAGCGTGVVGIALSELGVAVIDGIDISPEMLTVAAKATLGNKPVYRNLIEADLTRPVPLGTNTYSGLISVGTFTSGHLGPSSIDELIRVCAPGAKAAIGVKAQHFRTLGFEAHFDRLRDQQVIGNYELIETDVYESAPDDDGAVVAAFDVLRA